MGNTPPTTSNKPASPAPAEPPVDVKETTDASSADSVETASGTSEFSKAGGSPSTSSEKKAEE